MNASHQDDVEFALCEYLDGALSGREARRLQRRLAEDPDLADELKRYAALDEALASVAGAGPDGVDYDLQRAEVIAAIERRALLQPPRRRVLRPVFGALAAAAALLIGVMAWVVIVGRQTPPGPGEPVRVTLLSASPAVEGEGEVSVQITRPPVESLPLAPLAPRGGMPGGTIVVSVGHDDNPGDAAESLVIY